MTTLMILQDGPLDGEAQIIESVPNAPDSTLFFNLPHYQFFDQAGHVVGRGLAATYTFLEEGPPPDANDSWDRSSVLGYVGEAFLPPPGGLYPIVTVIDPNSCPANESVVFQVRGSGLLMATGIFMPQANEDSDARPVPTFLALDDRNATVTSITGPFAGLFDLSLAYLSGSDSTSYVRYSGAFRFTTATPGGGRGYGLGPYGSGPYGGGSGTAAGYGVSPYGASPYGS